MHSSAEAVRAEAGRDFWRGVLAAGGSTVMPRWTRDPIAGIAVHDAAIPSDIVDGVTPAGRRAGCSAQFSAAGGACQGALRTVR